MRWTRIIPLLFHLPVLVLMVAGCTLIPAQTTPAPPATTEAETTTTATTAPVTSPPITIALDYFGIRNTHLIPQVEGDQLAKIQLIVVVSDEHGTLAVWPPQSVQNLTFDMDYFEVKALKEKLNPPVVFSGCVDGTLVIYIAAYNVNKGLITKTQIDILSKWLGLPELNKLKDAIPDRELVGYYWQTWSASSGFRVGKRYDEQDGNLAVWFRIGSEQMPEPVEKPVLKPNVRIEAELPINVKVRTPYEYRASDFVFTLINNESFEFPIYWHLETTSNPGTEINYIIYPTEGRKSVPSNSTITVTNKYWFTTPGEYKWKYVAGYPRDNLTASWEGTLRVNP